MLHRSNMNYVRITYQIQIGCLFVSWDATHQKRSPLPRRRFAMIQWGNDLPLAPQGQIMSTNAPKWSSFSPWLLRGPPMTLLYEEHQQCTGRVSSPPFNMGVTKIQNSKRTSNYMFSNPPASFGRLIMSESRQNAALR